MSWSKPKYKQKKKKTRKGVPNLRKTESGYINRHGVEISKEERQYFQKLVDRTNYKRNKQLEKESTLPRKLGGRNTGDSVQSLQLMGRESDFIITKKSKSMQRFRSRKEFERYISNMEKILDPEYEINLARLYKRNYMKALDNEFGEMAKDVKMKVRMMKPEEFMKMVQSDELAEISYVYDESQREGRLNVIRATFGMKLKEESI